MSDSARRPLTRRNFISQVSTYLAGGLGLQACALLRENSHDFYAVGGIGSEIVVRNLKTQSDARIYSSVVGHSLLSHPVRPQLVLAIEKSGRKLALADIVHGRLIREIDAGANRVFYGHGVFSPDGRTLWSTQVDSISGLGYLREYSFPELAVVSDTQVAVGGVHDILLLPDRKTLVMTSSGVRYKHELGHRIGPKYGNRIERSSILFIDSAKRTITEKQFLNDESLICGHLASAQDGRIFCITTLFEDYRGKNKSPRGSIVWTRRGENFREVEVPTVHREQIANEFLSIAVNEKIGAFAVTNPQGNLLLEFDLKSLSLQKAIPSNSTGVAYHPLISNELLVLPQVPFRSAHWSVVAI